VALLFMSGGMRGVAGAGVAVALCDLGLHEVADVVIGASAGAPDAAYLLNGPSRVRLGASIYYEECVNGRFIKPSHPIVDIDYLMSVFASGPKALDVEEVRRSRPDFFVGATRQSDGVFCFINAKTAKPDMLTAIKAAVAMKVLYGLTVTVNGIEYIDDSVELLPIDLIVQQWQPTDILVIANQTSSGSMLDRTTDTLSAVMSVTQGQLGQAARLYGRRRRFLQTLAAIDQLPVNVGILWPPPGLNILSRKANKLIAVAEESYRQTMSLFGQPNAVPNLYRTP
jgi:predicted patatin/cPLA2 family phospholipase